jgi:hypothetical protein
MMLLRKKYSLLGSNWGSYTKKRGGKGRKTWGRADWRRRETCIRREPLNRSYYFKSSSKVTLKL